MSIKKSNSREYEQNKNLNDLYTGKGFKIK